jgi:delta 1-pyrroline-5-carboxylate dehydrogenase
MTLCERPDDLGTACKSTFESILQVIRYRREGLDWLTDDVNGSSYGLTFGRLRTLWTRRSLMS